MAEHQTLNHCQISGYTVARFAYLYATLSLRDEMLMCGISLAFAGVSHKLKLVSLGLIWMLSVTILYCMHR